MRLPKKSGSRRRSIYLPLWNGDHRDIALRSSFAFEEQRQIDLPAHRGNIGLIEQQTGRPSKKSPAEAGQGILEG
jgi:hypothetical protein